MVMFPVVALIISVVFEGLKIDTSLVVGTLLVLAGNLFVLKSEPPRRRPRLTGVIQEAA